MITFNAYDKAPRRGSESPWGAVQSEHEQAPGIVSVSTAGHGGIWLSPERLAQFRQLFPTFVGYSGAEMWLEEDCDASLAVLAFPDVFTDEAVFYAVRMVQGSAEFVSKSSPDYMREPREWLLSNAGEKLRAVADKFRQDHLAMWERGGCSTGGAGWFVYLYRGKESQTITMPDYPMQNWFTDADVAKYLGVGIPAERSTR